MREAVTGGQGPAEATRGARPGSYNIGESGSRSTQPKRVGPKGASHTNRNRREHGRSVRGCEVEHCPLR